MLDAGLAVMVNSDDPAYFGGYLHDNVVAATRALGLTPHQRPRLAEKSFRASFLSHADKARLPAAGGRPRPPPPGGGGGRAPPRAPRGGGGAQHPPPPPP